MSGIYIPWMSMPKTCDDCQVSADCPHDEHIDGYNMQKRPRFCQLVSVPEHGELIEREPILDVMRKERDRISETYGPNDEYVNCLNKYAINMVTSAKTIIPADLIKEEAE